MSIPNTLSIFINTRVRGSSKLKYSPDMSVENNKSTQVFFDPLIKLNYYGVNYIPKGLPESEKFTQFFSKSQFNSLIQRSLGAGSQPKRDLVTATKDGIVDNNIRITLDTLFHAGNPFYLNGKRFTVHSYEWESGDWEIQSTKSEKMKKTLNPYISRSQKLNYYPGYQPNPYLYNNRYPYIPQTPINVPPQALYGNVDPGISKLERAALGSGVGPLLQPKSSFNPKTDSSTESSTKPNQPPTPQPKPVIPPTPPKKIPEAKDKLCDQFKNYYLEGYKKGFIKNPITPEYMDSINQWTIQRNKASGDCFFEALRDSLNGYNEKAYSKNKILLQPYYDTKTDSYSVSSLRNAVANYISKTKEGETIYDTLVASVQSVINGLSNPQDKLPNEFRFLIGNNNEILTREEVAKKISMSSTPSERGVSEPPMSPEEYYWGDVLAVAASESMFQIKIVLISTESISGPGQNGSFVQFKDNNGDTIFGSVKNADSFGTDPSNHTADVETDSYATYPNVPISLLRQIPRYSIYCHDSDTDLTNVDRFIFMLYSNKNHFESLYVERARNNRKYLFNASEIPSYIKYMIFENCYRTLLPQYRSSSSYGKVQSIAKYLRDMETIYNAKIANGPNSLINSNKKLFNGGSTIGRQNFTRYNVGYDSNLTYYIVIDLELYPGDHIPLNVKASIACQLRYEKIRQSYADLFGLVYQPKELRLSEDMNKKYISKNKTKKETGGSQKNNNTRKR